MELTTEAIDHIPEETVDISAPDTSEATPEAPASESAPENITPPAIASYPSEEASSVNAATPSARANLIEELKLLSELIPGADIRRLDGDGWNALLGGESLILAYLGSERRLREAEEANKRNEEASVGSVGNTSSSLYTVEEIRRMDRGAVRKNLDKILRSLEKSK